MSVALPAEGRVTERQVADDDGVSYGTSCRSGKRRGTIAGHSPAATQ